MEESLREVVGNQLTLISPFPLIPELILFMKPIC